jgi:hypothetical protein
MTVSLHIQDISSYATILPFDADLHSGNLDERKSVKIQLDPDKFGVKLFNWLQLSNGSF